MSALPAARWVRAEFAPAGAVVADRPEIGALVVVAAAGSVHGVPFVRLVGTLGASPAIPADSLVGLA